MDRCLLGQILFMTVNIHSYLKKSIIQTPMIKYIFTPGITFERRQSNSEAKIEPFPFLMG